MTLKKQRIRQTVLSGARRKAVAIRRLLPVLPGIVLGYSLLPAIFLLLLALRPFLVVRVQPMISWRLGHFAGNIEMYLCERDAGLNVPIGRHLDIWYLWTEPCNLQLAAMWKRTLNIGPAWLLHPLHKLLAKIPALQAHLIPGHDRDIHNLLDASPSHLKFSEAEIARGQAGLRQLGIPAGCPFVCLNVRDSRYLGEQSRDAGANVDWSYHDYRNCNVQNYVKAADELTRRGYYVIRMGAAVNEPMRTSNPMVIDYAGKGLRSDFMDIFLGAHCAFCISNGTGFDAVPFIFRRPILYVDHVPVGIISTFSSRFMATTKDHWLKSENRQLSLEEILASDAAWYTKSQDFEAAGIELRESSPEDTAQAVLEMEGRLSGTWRSSEEDEKLQAYFWSIFPKNHLHGELRSRVGTHFLRTRLAGKMPDLRHRVFKTERQGEEKETMGQRARRYFMRLRKMASIIRGQLEAKDGRLKARIISKMASKLLVLFFIPPAIIALLLIRAIRPLFLIRFQILISERIGHFAGNTELYLCEQQAGLNVPSRPYIDLWYLNYPVCNKQLARMWRRKLHILPRLLLEPVAKLNALFPGGQMHQIGLNASHDRDIHNLLDRFPTSLSFTEQEMAKGKMGLQKLGLPEGALFVCLTVRDSKYLSKQLPWWNWTYHDYRNCNVQNYVKAAEELTRRGYYVIRMGAAVNEPMRTSNPMVIDYAGKGLRSDFMDIFLGAHCAFCISNGTGFDAVPFIFRRPILYVDHVPVGIISTFSSRFMATTKDHWLKSENRQLSLEEILASDAAWYTKSQDFEAAGIELRESSPEDTAQAVLEMEGRLSGTWRSSEEDEKLQAYFWSIFPKNHLHGELRSRVGTHFLHTRLEAASGKVPHKKTPAKAELLAD